MLQLVSFSSRDDLTDQRDSIPSLDSTDGQSMLLNHKKESTREQAFFLWDTVVSPPLSIVNVGLA